MLVTPREHMDEEAWLSIPGGAALITYFGHVPYFHDGEITQLVLNRRAGSTISIHIWGVDGVYPVKHAVVTIFIDDVIDLELENFSPQNVIGDLIIRPLANRADRRSYYPRSQAQSDIEIELVPIYGLSGVIRAGSVSLTFVPGKPRDA